MEKEEIDFFARFDTFFRNKETKKPNIFKIIITLLILSIVIFSVIEIQKCCFTVGYIAALLVQYILCLFWMLGFIPITVNKKYERRGLMAFVVNMLFISFTIYFVSNDTYMKNISFQIISLFSQLILLVHINRCVKINIGDDLSFLKATNYIMASIFTAFTFINVEGIVDIKNFIGFYYVAPMIMLQGLYELLDRKSKKLDDTPNNEV